MSNSSPFLWVDSPGHQKHDAFTRKQISKHVMIEIGKARRKPRKRRIMSKEYPKLEEEQVSQSQLDKIDRVINSQGHPEPGSDSVPDDEIVAIYRNPVNDATRTSLFSRMLSHEEFFGQNGAVCAHMWWDLCQLDIAATYQIDSMMDTNCRYLTEGTMPFDLDGPTSTMLHLKAVQETQRAIEDPARCYGTGLIAGITASIFAAVRRKIVTLDIRLVLAYDMTQYARGNDLDCLLHLRGLRTIIFNRPGGLFSLRSQPKLLMLISMCEITCMCTLNIAPEIPFPMSIFLVAFHSGPAQPLSPFSQAVEELWILQRPYKDATVAAFDQVVRLSDHISHEEATSYPLPAESIAGLIYTYRNWLIKAQIPIAGIQSQRISDWTKTMLASFDKLLEIISQDLQDKPEVISSSVTLRCSGLDVLKVIILTCWSGVSAHKLSLMYDDNGSGLRY